MNVNKVILVGRLTRDPELRSTPNGQSVANVNIATNRFWTDKNGQRQDKTEFHTVILWGKTAEIAGQYLTKGQEAYFEGRLESRSYKAKDGSDRRITEVVAETMQLGSRPSGSSAGSARPTQSNNAVQSAPTEEQIPTINLDEESEEIRIEDVPF